MDGGGGLLLGGTSRRCRRSRSRNSSSSSQTTIRYQVSHPHLHAPSPPQPRPTCDQVRTEVGRVLKLICKDGVGFLCRPPPCHIDKVVGVRDGYGAESLHLRPQGLLAVGVRQP